MIWGGGRARAEDGGGEGGYGLLDYLRVDGAPGGGYEGVSWTGDAGLHVVGCL